MRKAKKLIKKNNSLKCYIQKTLTRLEANPFNSVLKTHLVIRKNGKEGFSSCVTGDIRIVWEFEDRRAIIIDLVDIGGHSGKNKVYK